MSRHELAILLVALTAVINTSAALRYAKFQSVKGLDRTSTREDYPPTLQKPKDVINLSPEPSIERSQTSDQKGVSSGNETKLSSAFSDLRSTKNVGAGNAAWVRSYYKLPGITIGEVPFYDGSEISADSAQPQAPLPNDQITLEEVPLFGARTNSNGQADVRTSFTRLKVPGSEPKVTATVGEANASNKTQSYIVWSMGNEDKRNSWSLENFGGKIRWSLNDKGEKSVANTETQPRENITVTEPTKIGETWKGTGNESDRFENPAFQWKVNNGHSEPASPPSRAEQGDWKILGNNGDGEWKIVDNKGLVEWEIIYEDGQWKVANRDTGKDGELLFLNEELEYPKFDVNSNQNAWGQENTYSDDYSSYYDEADYGRPPNGDWWENGGDVVLPKVTGIAVPSKWGTDAIIYSKQNAQDVMGDPVTDSSLDTEEKSNEKNGALFSTTAQRKTGEESRGNKANPKHDKSPENLEKEVENVFRRRDDAEPSVTFPKGSQLDNVPTKAATRARKPPSKPTPELTNVDRIAQKPLDESSSKKNVPNTRDRLLVGHRSQPQKTGNVAAWEDVTEFKPAPPETGANTQLRVDDNKDRVSKPSLTTDVESNKQDGPKFPAENIHPNLDGILNEFQIAGRNRIKVLGADYGPKSWNGNVIWKSGQGQGIWNPINGTGTFIYPSGYNKGMSLVLGNHFRAENDRSFVPDAFAASKSEIGVIIPTRRQANRLTGGQDGGRRQQADGTATSSPSAIPKPERREDNGKRGVSNTTSLPWPGSNRSRLTNQRWKFPDDSSSDASRPTDRQITVNSQPENGYWKARPNGVSGPGWKPSQEITGAGGWKPNSGDGTQQQKQNTTVTVRETSKNEKKKIQIGSSVSEDDIIVYGVRSEDSPWMPYGNPAVRPSGAVWDGGEDEPEDGDEIPQARPWAERPPEEHQREDTPVYAGKSWKPKPGLSVEGGRWEPQNGPWATAGGDTGGAWERGVNARPVYQPPGGKRKPNGPSQGTPFVSAPVPPVGLWKGVGPRPTASPGAGLSDPAPYPEPVNGKVFWPAKMNGQKSWKPPVPSAEPPSYSRPPLPPPPPPPPPPQPQQPETTTSGCRPTYAKKSWIVPADDGSVPPSANIPGQQPGCKDSVPPEEGSVPYLPPKTAKKSGVPIYWKPNQFSRSGAPKPSGNGRKGPSRTRSKNFASKRKQVWRRPSRNPSRQGGSSPMGAAQVANKKISYGGYRVPRPYNPSRNNRIAGYPPVSSSEGMSSYGWPATRMNGMKRPAAKPDLSPAAQSQKPSKLKTWKEKWKKWLGLA